VRAYAELAANVNNAAKTTVAFIIVFIFIRNSLLQLHPFQYSDGEFTLV
jgi:hypothetical protein